MRYAGIPRKTQVVYLFFGRLFYGFREIVLSSVQTSGQARFVLKLDKNRRRAVFKDLILHYNK